MSKPFRKKTLAIVGISLVASLGALFLARGWVRATLIPAYVDRFYRPALNKQFDKDFGELTPELAKHGFTYDEQHGYLNACWSGGDVMFEGWRETVPCYRAQNNDPKLFTPELADNWKQNSPSLEQFLLQRGWHKEWNADQPIQEIFDHEDGAGVVYTKTHGKTICALQIFAHPDGSVNASQSCSRNVAFFGGY